MRRLPLALTSAFLLSCATPGGGPKEQPPAAAPKPQPIAGKVMRGDKPLPGVRVVVLKHRAPLGAEPPCACEDHPPHPLGECPAPESTEQLAALARSEPESAPVSHVTTSADGTFTTPPLDDGRYDLGVQVEGALGWKTDVAPGARDAEVLPRPTSTVRGVVRGPDGKPAAGAEVVVSGTEMREVRGVVAGPDGTFEVAGIPFGPALVVASAKGLTAAKGVPAPEAAEDGSLGFAPLGFRLRAKITLRGTVTRAGKPVAGADVLAQSDCRTYRTRSGADGSFELADLPPRDYPVSAISGSEGAQVVASLEAPGPLSLSLRLGGVLAGTVKDKKGPLAGAEVVAVPRQPRGAAELRRARSHQDGSFELGPIPPGPWEVEVAAAGHLSRPPEELRVAPKARQALEVELQPAMHIAGDVVNDLADGLPGAEVEAVRSDADPGCLGCRLRTRTSPDGSFVLYPLAQGEYTVRFSHDRYLPAEARKIGPTDTLRQVLKPGASLLGTVKDPESRAAVRALASLEGAGGAVVRPPRPVDPNGTFRLEGLAPGTYAVVVESQDPLPRRATAPVTIEADANATAELSLPPGAALAGRVADDAGKPVGRAEVQLAPEGGHGMAVLSAGEDGAFEAKGLPPGKYRVSAWRDGFFAGPKSSVVAETGALKVTPVLSRLPAVKGRVRAPASVAEVWVNGERQALDAQRRFRATLLRTGKQVVVVEAAAAAPAVKVVDLAYGREVDLGDLSLDPGRTVEGKVLDPEGKPVPRASVLVVDPAAKDALRERLAFEPEGHPPVKAALTDEAGAFRVEHAPAGAAVLLAAGGELLPAEVPVPPKATSVTATEGASGLVLVKVLDEGGGPVRGSVVLLPADPRAEVTGSALPEGANSTLGFKGLPPGQWTAAVNALPNADGSLMVFDPAEVSAENGKTTRVELRARATGATVTVRLQLPGTLGTLAAKLLPADALEAPAPSLYRRLFLAMPSEPSLAEARVFRHAPPGPQTLVLLRDLGAGQLGLDRRRIDVPASGELAVTVDQVKLETVLREER